MKKNNLAIKYLVLTFLISWICWFVLAFLTKHNSLQYGQPLFMIIFVLGGIGPLIASFIIKKCFTEKEEYQYFIKALFSFKVNYIWYIWLMVTPLVII